MALGTDKKLGVAVVVLAVLGGVVWYQNKKQKEEAQSYTAEGRSASAGRPFGFRASSGGSSRAASRAA